MEGVSSRQKSSYDTIGGLSSVLAAAHELKSPLVLVRQLSLMLESNDLSPDDRRHIHEQIVLTSERALRLTSDLTRSANLENGLFELEPINPVQLCEDVAIELRPLFSAHGRNIRALPRKKQALVVANRDLLKRIVVNFSDNALHYTDANSEVELQIKTLNKGEIIRLGVRDYGPAIKTDLWRSLCKRLAVAAPQSIQARPQSSGLGLYIANSFARVMNGRIGVIRHQDGATFFVDLQASQQLSWL